MTTSRLPEDPLGRFREVYDALNAERGWFQGASTLRFAAMTAMCCPGTGRETARGIRRIADEIKKMVDTVNLETKKGLHDRALLLFGFAGAFRRSELVALNTWNLEEREEGLKVTIGKHKAK